MRWGRMTASCTPTPVSQEGSAFANYQRFSRIALRAAAFFDSPQLSQPRSEAVKNSKALTNVTEPRRSEASCPRGGAILARNSLRLPKLPSAEIAKNQPLQ